MKELTQNTEVDTYPVNNQMAFYPPVSGKSNQILSCDMLQEQEDEIEIKEYKVKKRDKKTVNIN